MKTPSFWSYDGVVARALNPIGILFSALGTLNRKIKKPYDAGIPIICIGNIVAGGAGKTPVAISIGTKLINMGYHICFLSRGHGGRLKGPIKVDNEKHCAELVGDEALLLSEIAPTWVSKDRRLGADAAKQDGLDVIIMDDGFQNPHPEKKLSILVVDAIYGFGNERVMPAGPLRETIKSGMSRANAVVVMGEETSSAAKYFPKTLPLFKATIQADGDCELHSDTNVIGFAGIARPEKFRKTLADLRFNIKDFKDFADHHPYSLTEIKEIHKCAKSLDATPVTTAKDHVRLPKHFRKNIVRVNVSVHWKNETSLTNFLYETLKNG